MDEIEIKKVVRERYAEVVESDSSCCGSDAGQSSCCGGASATDNSRRVGYSDAEMASVPEGANLGLGCGNPTALAALKEGETVIDLGSGGGFDCFLAAAKVGEKGRVIGVDMTPEMLARARENAAKSGYNNVEFRLGEIENLPVADATADVIISNCVINLAPDKPRVFREAFRVLKPGGRLMVSDIVLTRPLPAAVMQSVAAYAGCVAGASLMEDYFGAIEQAGFTDVRVLEEASLSMDFVANDPAARDIAEELNLGEEEARQTMDAVRSVRVAATKPL
jgi:arsenite methyltransferase